MSTSTTSPASSPATATTSAGSSATATSSATTSSDTSVAAAPTAAPGTSIASERTSPPLPERSSTCPRATIAACIASGFGFFLLPLLVSVVERRASKHGATSGAASSVSNPSDDAPCISSSTTGSSSAGAVICSAAASSRSSKRCLGATDELEESGFASMPRVEWVVSALPVAHKNTECNTSATASRLGMLNSFRI